MSTGNNAEISEVAEVVEYDDLNLETYDQVRSHLESRNPGPSGRFDFLLHREWVISRHTWTTLQTRNQGVASIYPFDVIGRKPQVTALRDLHYMWRCDIELTVEIVSTFNMSGAVMISPVHCDWMTGFPNTQATAPVELMSLMPHYIAFASDQNVVRFVLPFQSQYDYAYTPHVAPAGNNYNPLVDWAKQWYVLVKVLHPLTNSTGAGSCEIVVRGKIVDHEFVLPHIVDDETSSARVVQSSAKHRRDQRKSGQKREAVEVQKEGVVSDFLKSTARFSSWVGDLTGFSGIGTAVSGVAASLGNVAESFGFQKPAQVSAPQSIAFGGLMDKRSGQARGVADAYTFNIGTDNDQSVPEHLYAFSTQTNDFREYACIPSIVARGSFDASTAQGTLLGEVPIYPHVWNVSFSGNRYLAPAQVATQFCQMYTGDLQHMLVFSSSKFVTTKIAIQIGTHSSGTPTLNSIGDTYTKVLTLNGSGIVTFRTPFFHPRRVADTRVLSDQIHVHMFLLSVSVQTPGDTATGIATHFDWYSAFAPNCRFFVPVPEGNNLTRDAWPAGWAKDRQAASGEDRMMMQCDPRAEFQKLFDPFVEAKMLVYDDALFPDEIMHWNDVRMRWSRLTSAQDMVNVDQPDLMALSVGCNGTDLFRPRWQKVYARWRCTMRYATMGVSEVEGTIYSDATILAMQEYELGAVASKKPPPLPEFMGCTQVLSGPPGKEAVVVEVPRWRSTNYDARTQVPTGTEGIQLSRNIHIPRRCFLFAAGDSTVGFVPMGLWLPS